jgi:hypothetical protein
MNARYYHTPPQPVSTRVRCPVCHKEVYSRAGIHPQCAFSQSDPARPKAKKGVPVSPELPDRAGDQAGAVVAVADPAAERVPVPALLPV